MRNVGEVWKMEMEQVSFESRTAQMSVLFHIFTCAFCSKRQRREATKIFLRNPRIFFKNIFNVVTLSTFAEIVLTPASFPERKDGRQH